MRDADRPQVAMWNAGPGDVSNGTFSTATTFTTSTALTQSTSLDTSTLDDTWMKYGETDDVNLDVTMGGDGIDLSDKVGYNFDSSRKWDHTTTSGTELTSSNTLECRPQRPIGPALATGHDRHGAAFSSQPPGDEVSRDGQRLCGVPSNPGGRLAPRVGHRWLRRYDCTSALARRATGSRQVILPLLWPAATDESQAASTRGPSRWPRSHCCSGPR